MLVSEVKLSQTFILQQVQEISQPIFKVSLPATITFIYKLTQVCTDDAQKNYLWQEGRLSFLHLKKYWGYRLSTSSVEIESEWDW